MRGMIAVGMLVVAGGACGPGSYDLEPRAAHDYQCTFDLCSLMAGAETFARSAFYTDVDESALLESVTVSPPELAEVTVSGADLAIRTPPGAEGFGVFHVVTESGYRYERPFKVRPRAGSALIPDGDYAPLASFPERRLPGERLAIFEAEELIMVLEHRAVDGETLLGHTREPWTATGVQLAEVDPTWNSNVDRDLLRAMRVTTAGQGSVSAGTSTLPIDVVRAGTTSRIEIYESGGTKLPELRTRIGNYRSVDVVAYAADGRFIYGGPPYLPLVVEINDPSVISVRAQPSGFAQRHVTFIAGETAGSTTVQFRFDGAASTLPVVVE